MTSKMRQIVNMEKSWALHLARNSKDSHFGNALLEENTKETRLLDHKIQRLEKERYRKSLHAAQVRNMFLHERSSLPEPLLIVERAPSPEIIRRAELIRTKCEDIELPSYQRPLKRKTKPPSTLLTIDAFEVRNRKKTNVWEEALRESEEPHFQSRVIPSFPLTTPEIAELQRGRRAHRPKSYPGNKSRSRSQRSQKTPKTPGDLEEVMGQQADNSGTFITQLPPDAIRKGKFGKSVQFSIQPDTLRLKKAVRVPAATALVVSKNGVQVKTKSSKEQKSEDLRTSLRKWLKETKDLL